jgi:hypothetical protein
LQLDHVKGRVPDTPFACLCANCHTLRHRPTTPHPSISALALPAAGHAFASRVPGLKRRRRNDTMGARRHP